MSVLRVTVYLILIFAIVLYIQLALRVHAHPNDEIEIVQTHLGNLTDSILLEKTPVIVHDRIVSVSSFIVSHFRFLYLFENVLQPSDYTTKVTSRFLILHNTSDVHDLTIEIGFTPSNKIPVSLSPYNALILPAGSYYRTNSAEITNAVGLNDLVHYLFYK